MVKSRPNAFYGFEVAYDVEWNVFHVNLGSVISFAYLNVVFDQFLYKMFRKVKAQANTLPLSFPFIFQEHQCIHTCSSILLTTTIQVPTIMSSHSKSLIEVSTYIKHATITAQLTGMIAPQTSHR
jgi:hypothetical protein